MPNTTQAVLKRAAGILTANSLHTGEQFANKQTGSLDICAAIYWAAHSTEQPPAEFYTDELAALRLIECSAPAMQTIRALSDALPSKPPLETLPNGVKVPNYIDHVSNWARTAPIGETFPPSTSEVIGRLIRTAQALEADLARFPHQRAA